MTIINKSKELTKMEQYALTKSPEIGTVSKLADGEIMKIEMWVSYQDVNSKGEQVDLLSFKTDAGDVYATQSQTFYNSFMDIVDLMDEGQPAGFTIKKISGTAKSGREYINCVLIDA